MASRKLNDQETELTIKGINRVKLEKETYQSELETISIHKEFLLKKRAYDDYMRPINRKKEDTEIENSIKGYESEIKMADEKIKSMESQLNEGVEEKQDIPSGVN